MFNLIAIIFLVANGVEATEPATMAKNGFTFPSQAECEGFMETDKGAQSKKALESIVRAHFEGQEFVAKFACVEVKKDDGEKI